MKKMIYLFILVFSLSTLVACSDDEGTPVFTEPTEFVLNVPKYASGIYDLKNTATIQLTCSQPDYGFTAATRYTFVCSSDGFRPDRQQIRDSRQHHHLEHHRIATSSPLLCFARSDSAHQSISHRQCVRLGLEQMLFHDSGSFQRRYVLVHAISGSRCRRE